jgi:2-succinyl-5-enolpyruvyl-6-hydroxy-3-cyclohexene-1-carboxylate synthase
MTTAVLQAEWCALFFDALAAAGVEDVFIVPGGNSTPLMLAAVRNAQLRCRPFADERSAAFFALGYGKRSGRPAVVLCTSNSAAAQCHPAVVEADGSFTPMIIVAAELGAGQQIDLFGRSVRMMFDLGPPEMADLIKLRRRAAQLVHVALAPEPGPVHVHAPALLPLAPLADATSEDDRVRDQVRPLYVYPVTWAAEDVRGPDPDAIEALAVAIRAARRGVIVAGPAAVSQASARTAVARVAKRTGFPILAEATSQLRWGIDPRRVPVCDGFPAWFASRRARELLSPDLIVRIGDTPAALGWPGFSDWNLGRPRAVVTPFGWRGVESTARVLLQSDAAAAFAALRAALGPGRVSSETRRWMRALTAVSALVWKHVDAEIASTRALSDATVTRETMAALPTGGLLVLGNSMPIRAVDFFCPADSKDLDVVCQRATGDIAGSVSVAAGAASAGDTPTALLIGDASLLHDIGGLAAARAAPAPLAVVVVDNEGGRLFERNAAAFVPDLGDAFERYWLAPPRVDWGHAAQAFGVAYAEADRPRLLRRALQRALSRSGCTVIRAIVPPDIAWKPYDRVTEAVDDEIEAVVKRATARR